MTTFLKYEPAISAADPILRCDDCKKITAKLFISQKGCCFHCGNRRFKTISTMEKEDIDALKAGTYPLGVKDYEMDPDFFASFTEEVSDV